MELIQFCLRCKTSDIASDFLTSVKDALSMNDVKVSSQNLTNISDEDKQRSVELKLSADFDVLSVRNRDKMEETKKK